MSFTEKKDAYFNSSGLFFVEIGKTHQMSTSKIYLLRTYFSKGVNNYHFYLANY